MEQPIDVQDKFLEEYTNWIKKSKLNSFTGLDYFPNKFISLGVTQAIDDYILFCFKKNLKLRMFKGEYPYARESSDILKNNKEIDDFKLLPGDAVLISCPFSATGDKHPNWDWLVDECTRLSIPIFVDCAFFGTCRDIVVDFSFDCFDTISFSPTKGLNCGNFRTGISFTKRKGKDCTLDILQQWHHGIHMHTALALELLKKYGPDTIPDRYTEIQKQVCDYYELTPTKTIHLALGNNEWSYFNRDNICNRIGIKFPIGDLARGEKLK